MGMNQLRNVHAAKFRGRWAKRTWPDGGPLSSEYPNDAAVASAYAHREDEHANAGTLIQRDYEQALGELIPSPRGRQVSGKDMRMWSGIGFVSSVPVFASMMSAAALTPAPLLVTAAAAALPAAGIAVRNAVLGARVERWKKTTAAQRETDRPRIDKIKALAFVEAVELSGARWAATENAVAALREDITV